MGMTPLSLEIFNKHIHLVDGLNNCRIIELGDQQMYCHPNIPEGSAAKSWFERMGAHHVSVDLNGELGAIKEDLSRPIERYDWVEAFDVVTDYGTSEHVGKSVEALYHCRANCHGWCRPGGLLFFNNPMTGHWPDHGYHYFTEEHYKQIAELADYEIIDLFNHPTLGNSVDGFQIYAVMIKRRRGPFVSLEQFAELYPHTLYPS